MPLTGLTTFLSQPRFTCWGTVLPTMVWILLHQLAVNKMSYRQSLWGQFLKWGFLLPGVSSWQLMLTTTVTHYMGPKCPPNTDVLMAWFPVMELKRWVPVKGYIWGLPSKVTLTHLHISLFFPADPRWATSSAICSYHMFSLNTGPKQQGSYRTTNRNLWNSEPKENFPSNSVISSQ